MNLTTNKKTYPGISYRPSADGCVIVAGEAVAVGAELRIETDDGAVLRTYTVAEYLRCEVEDGRIVLSSTPKPTPPPVDIEAVRADVLARMSEAQQAAIMAGVSVVTETVGDEHFTLTLTDQTNINDMFYGGVLLGAQGYLYHADAADCRYYPAGDIIAIYVAKQQHITYHTTYGNLLRRLARQQTDADALAAIAYGQQLPADLETELAALLAQAQAEMEAVIARLTGGAQNA